ncbi:MAG: hypothetical protein HFG54_11850 [Lachnospiraceae bacterium]|jgi:hypothetical protein|nr:hypothetical protein [Lachnospiraceae bacterium]
MGILLYYNRDSNLVGVTDWRKQTTEIFNIEGSEGENARRKQIGSI